MPLSHPSTSTAPGSILRMVAISMMGAGLCASFTAMADESADDVTSSTSWALGLGVTSAQKPYTDIDRDNTPIPLLQVENRYVHLFGPRVEFKLPGLDIDDSQALDFAVVAKYDGSGYEDDDAPILDGMSEREGGIWAGAKMAWSSDLFDVSAEWLADASGNSDGQRVDLGLERTWQVGNHVLLTPHLGASWQDENTIDYYFGVRDDEVRIGRPAYAGESGVNVELGVRGVYRFDAHHSVLMNVEVESLADEIQESPLVDRSTVNSVSIGYLYRF